MVSLINQLIAIFYLVIELIIKFLEFTSYILKKIEYDSQCSTLKNDIKSKIKILISNEVTEINKNPKHIKMCYLLSASVIHFILLVNNVYATELLLSIFFLILFSLLIGVVLQFFYVSFLHLKSYLQVSKKYRQFKNLPHNYEELVLIKKIVDSF